MITREKFDTMIRVHETDKILAHFDTSNSPLIVLCPGSGSSWKEQFNSKEEYLKRMEAWNGGYTTWVKYKQNFVW